jgi:hypothetical protein
MKHTVCNQIRLEIDESELGATLSSTAMQHLRECGECQDFQNKQTKLRQIVGSLETVNAPADFDFRLRARLASGEEHSGYQFLSSWPLMRSAGLALVGLILLVIGSFVFLRQFVPREQQMAETKPAATKEDTTSKQPDTARENVNQASNVGASANQSLAENFGTYRRRSVASKPNLKRATVTVDMGSTSAPVIRSSQSVAGMTTFPLDISQESFKVSIDDGRGTSRTISLPGVSFGSRRVLTGRNVSHQFAPNGAW